MALGHISKIIDRVMGLIVKEKDLSWPNNIRMDDVEILNSLDPETNEVMLCIRHKPTGAQVEAVGHLWLTMEAVDRHRIVHELSEKVEKLGIAGGINE